MSRLVRSISGEIGIENWEFLLLDVEGASGLPEGSVTPWDIKFEPGQLAGTCVNGAIISSDHPEHDADVVLELWDGEPSKPTGADVKFLDCEFTSTSGRVTLDTSMGDAEGFEVFDLGQLHTTWKLRVIRRYIGPGNPADLTETFEGLESFLIQFWAE
ncbi:hypothetical protein ACIBF6_44260 [Streptosporangium amethystogenes]|uniref:hypothetical protein n=1 Tax=Streptosporangium amethystogenes TaxID=2002 RepID=UPI0037BB536F